MSLLLEALKKAEKAKEEAQRRAGEPAAPATTELSLQAEQPPAAQPSAGAKPVVTRTQLPDISQPLEIVSDDIAPKAGAAAAPSAPASSAPRAQASARAAAAEPTAQRAAARKVFEAKFKESNPRMPFYLTLGVLGAFALGTIGYFWYQLRPPAPLVNANPATSGNVKPVAVAQAPSSSSALPAKSTTGLPGAAGGTTNSIPGLPSSTPPAAQPPSAPPATSAQSAPRTPEPRRETPASAPARQAAPAPRQEVTPTTSSRMAEVNPKVQSGYSAYMAGDFERAGNEYREALREEPANRDALLGLAAVETRSGRLEAAEALYLRRLEADPRDPNAQAALLALRAGRLDPLAAESRVKTLLAAEPNAHVLNFALGNQLAQQDRWAEAQQQYFKAFSAEPENADYAYNLAVSLDHLRQPKLALEYYQRAMALAGARGASFDAATARTRIQQLAR
ncbi:MAG: tetratricopeptide repeat protein [Clostridia bacterium]